MQTTSVTMPHMEKDVTKNTRTNNNKKRYQHKTQQTTTKTKYNSSKQEQLCIADEGEKNMFRSIPQYQTRGITSRGGGRGEGRCR